MSSIVDPIRAAADLAAFYRDAGIDVAIDEEAHDRFAESAAERSHRERASPETRQPATPTTTGKRPPLAGRAAPPTQAVIPRPSTTPVAPDEAIQSARELAANADTLDALRATLEAFDGCALKATAKQLVFADGNPEARLMFVGEAPGQDEDKIGLPFVGRAGQLLDRMLAAIGLDRTKAYIANVIPWRPPGNRTPTPQELAICKPFIERQIALVDPDILVCIGNPSTQTLLDARVGILKARGRWVTYDTGKREIRAIATLHPAYLLRQPAQKKYAWSDLKAIRKALGETAPKS